MHRLALGVGFLLSTVVMGCGGGGLGVSDAASLLDAGADQAQAPIIPTSDPTLLACGTAICATTAEMCCYSSTRPGGAADHCVPQVTSSCGEPRSSCDETADCMANQLCCGADAVLPQGSSATGFKSGNCELKTTASCRPQPGVGTSAFQFCKTTAECLNATRCLPYDCFGRRVFACVKPGGCTDPVLPR